RINRIITSGSVSLPGSGLSLKSFMEYNPFAILKPYSDEAGKKYYYGPVLTTDILDDIALRVNADVAVVWDDAVAEVSNKKQHEQLLHSLNEAVRFLRQPEDNKIYLESSGTEDIAAALTTPVLTNEV